MPRRRYDPATRADMDAEDRAHREGDARSDAEYAALLGESFRDEDAGLGARRCGERAGRDGLSSGTRMVLGHDVKSPVPTRLPDHATWEDPEREPERPMPEPRPDEETET